MKLSVDGPVDSPSLEAGIGVDKACCGCHDVRVDCEAKRGLGLSVCGCPQTRSLRSTSN